VSIEIVPYKREWIDAVKAFNERLRKGGIDYHFYEDPTPDWLPPVPGRKVYREYFLAVEDRCVRGAYVLKKEQFHIFGMPHSIASWQGPCSEGTVDSSYNSLGLSLLLDMTRREPLLFGWGMGDISRPLPRMLTRLGWDVRTTPIAVKILRPFRFLRRNGMLRRSAPRRLALDSLAFSGAGSLLLRVWFAWKRRNRPRRAVTVEVVDEFDDWADRLWESASPAYSFVGLRDRSTLNAVFPAEEARFSRLKISERREAVGWAVLSKKRMEADPRFGTLHVGTIVDCFAPPEYAAPVIESAYKHLAEHGVDLVISNQTHPAWIEAFSRVGFLVVPNKRVFAASKKLSRLLRKADPEGQGMHLTNADGDGPLGL